jgi:hypothetical protein
MKRSNELWNYLEQSGVLERGDDAEIKAVKKEYRKRYLLEYKRAQRTKKREITIGLDASTGEWSKFLRAAKRHHLSLPAFIKSAVDAYLDQKYLVPDPYQVAQLEQLLSFTLNEIQEIAGRRGNFYGLQNEYLKEIEVKIERLEGEINRIFRHPNKMQISNDSQSKIA